MVKTVQEWVFMNPMLCLCTNLPKRKLVMTVISLVSQLGFIALSNRGKKNPHQLIQELFPSKAKMFNKMRLDKYWNLQSKSWVYNKQPCPPNLHILTGQSYGLHKEECQKHWDLIMIKKSQKWKHNLQDLLLEFSKPSSTRMEKEYSSHQ